MIPTYFSQILIISPLKGAWSFIWTKLNSLYPREICTKFDWNWHRGSGKKKSLQTGRQTYMYGRTDRWQPNKRCMISFQIRWAKGSLAIMGLTKPNNLHDLNIISINLCDYIIYKWSIIKTYLFHFVKYSNSQPWLKRLCTYLRFSVGFHTPK